MFHTKVNFSRAWQVALVAVGVWLRCYQSANYHFGFDQVQILGNAEAILAGDLTLIGPRTGPAEMFTGPLIYYLAAGVLAVAGFPLVLPGLVALVSLVTGLVLVWLGQRYLQGDRALVLVGLWALSPMVVELDRVVWNPNLSFLAASLVWLPLWHQIQEKRAPSRRESLLLGLGVFLSYQAHFSAILVWLAVAGLTVWKRSQGKNLAALAAGSSLSLAPTVLFDWRHGWINLKGLAELLVHERTATSGSFLDKLWVMVQLVIEVMGGLAGAGSMGVVIWLVGLAGLYLWVSRQRREKTSAKLAAWFWVTLVFTLGFSGYRRSVPPYYWLMWFPLGLLVWSEVAGDWMAGKRWWWLAGAGLVLINLKNIDLTRGGFNLENQIAARDYVVGNGLSARRVIFDMEPVYTDGLAYLLRDVARDQDGGLLHVAYPQRPGNKAAAEFGPIAVWFAPLIQEGRNYLETDKMIVETPEAVFLYPDGYRTQGFFTREVYRVEYQDAKLGTLAVYDRKREDKAYDAVRAEYERLKQELVLGNWGWVKGQVWEKPGYLKASGRTMLFFSDYNEEADYLGLLSQIVFYYGSELPAARR